MPVITLISILLLAKSILPLLTAPLYSKTIIIPKKIECRVLGVMHFNSIGLTQLLDDVCPALKNNYICDHKSLLRTEDSKRKNLIKAGLNFRGPGTYTPDCHEILTSAISSPRTLYIFSKWKILDFFHSITKLFDYKINKHSKKAQRTLDYFSNDWNIHNSKYFNNEFKPLIKIFKLINYIILIVSLPIIILLFFKSNKSSKQLVVYFFIAIIINIGFYSFFSNPTNPRYPSRLSWFIPLLACILISNILFPKPNQNGKAFEVK